MLQMISNSLILIDNKKCFFSTKSY